MTKKVGYKSPPDHSKWPKGKSGNPSGRKKGQRNLKTDLVDELGELVQINEAGKARKLTKQRALLKSLAARAIKGDARASALLLNLMTRLLEPEPEESTDSLAAADQALLDDFLATLSAPKGQHHDQ